MYETPNSRFSVGIGLTLGLHVLSHHPVWWMQLTGKVNLICICAETHLCCSSQRSNINLSTIATTVAIRDLQY